MRSFLYLGWDTRARHIRLKNKIIGRRILDVGGTGILSFFLNNVAILNLNVKRCPGVGILASAVALPFINESFDTVCLIDTIEHIPGKMRKKVLEEAKRVCKFRVVIHSPLQNGLFVGRLYDCFFQQWHLKKHHKAEINTQEHLENAHPSPQLLKKEGFKIYGDFNADLWLICMKIQFSPPPYRFTRFVGRLIAHLIYILNAKKAKNPHLWGKFAFMINKKEVSKVIDVWDLK